MVAGSKRTLAWFLKVVWGPSFDHDTTFKEVVIDNIHVKVISYCALGYIAFVAGAIGNNFVTNVTINSIVDCTANGNTTFIVHCNINDVVANTMVDITTDHINHSIAYLTQFSLGSQLNYWHHVAIVIDHSLITFVMSFVMDYDSFSFDDIVIIFGIMTRLNMINSVDHKPSVSGLY